MRVMLPGLLALLAGMFCLTASAAPAKKLRSPVAGVVCDTTFCADAHGVSTPLTARYLGKKSASRLDAQGAFDRSQFTFTNGVSCDIKEKLCRGDRYFGADGKRNGKPDPVVTRQLFGQ